MESPAPSSPAAGPLPDPVARVQKMLRSILAGNGVDPRDLQLEDARIAPITFTAAVRIKLTAQIARRQMPGRDAKGDMVADERSLAPAVDRYLAGIVAHAGQRQPMIDLLLKRPDKGFGFDDKAISFKSLSHTFVAYEGCVPCHRSGQLLCPMCEGRRQVQCPQCYGQREIQCPNCHGSGHGPNGQGSCPTCQGRGRTRCPTCQGNGAINCKNCQATGRMKCRQCNGTGWMSTLMIAEPEAQYRFALDTRTLPAGAETVIRRQGARLMSSGQAQITVGAVATAADDPQIQPGEIIVSYQGTMPWGPVRFTIGTLTINAILYGTKGALYECPPFLERLAGDTIAKLVTAAQSRRAAGDLLPKIARTRFIRDALQASLMRVRAKAIEQYKARYPYGISDQMIRDLLALAETALRRASLDFRLYGAAAALAAGTLMLSVYYLGPGLPLALHAIPSRLGQFGMDLSLILAIMTLVYQLPRVTGAYALKRVLGSVMSVDKLRRLMPRAGRLEWGAVLTIPVVAASCILFLKTTGGEIPAWLHLFGL